MTTSPNAPLIHVSITHKGTSHTLEIPISSTFRELQLQIEELTGVPPELQKLLYKGKKATTKDAEDVTVQDTGLKDGVKVTLMGSTIGEISGMKGAEKEMNRREEILRQRAARGPTKLRSTGSSTSAILSYRFHSIQSLSHLPNPIAAQQVLTKLAHDPAVQHVMIQHKFSVGLLTELAPHEHPELLGLNENKGQAIRLRLRTDDYDGMRTYKEIRRVLMHELTHNVWGDHDNNFKELNSQLNREVADFEQAARNGAHSLTGWDANNSYQSVDEAGYSHSHVLGGSSGSDGVSLSESREAMRQRVLEASLKRLALEEQEIEDRCGSDGPAKLT